MDIIACIPPTLRTLYTGTDLHLTFYILPTIQKISEHIFLEVLRALVILTMIVTAMRRAHGAWRLRCIFLGS